MHAYFMHPGDNSLPIDYKVTTMKNGRSFDMRRVVASQLGKEIFEMMLSYQILKQE